MLLLLSPYEGATLSSAWPHRTSKMSGYSEDDVVPAYPWAMVCVPRSSGSFLRPHTRARGWAEDWTFLPSSFIHLCIQIIQILPEFENIYEMLRCYVVLEINKMDWSSSWSLTVETDHWNVSSNTDIMAMFPRVTGHFLFQASYPTKAFIIRQCKNKTIDYCIAKSTVRLGRATLVIEQVRHRDILKIPFFSFIIYRNIC